MEVDAMQAFEGTFAHLFAECEAKIGTELYYYCSCTPRSLLERRCCCWAPRGHRERNSFSNRAQKDQSFNRIITL